LFWYLLVFTAVKEKDHQAEYGTIGLYALVLNASFVLEKLTDVI